MYDITDYHEATSLAEVFKLAAADPKARIVAGGTDTLVKSRAEVPAFTGIALIGITRIPELQGIVCQEDGTLNIGALNTFVTIEHDPLIQQYTPLLSQAVSLVGGPQTRHMGTIGGNICNAGPAADSAPALFTYNTTCEIQGPDGVKNVPIADFYRGPGQTILKPGEVLTRFKIKACDYQDFHGHYTKFARRNALDIANLSCAALVKVQGEQIRDLRLCFGAAGPTPLRMPVAEAYAKGKPLTAATLAQIGQLCLQDTHDITDWRDTKAFRDHLVTVLPGRDITAALRGA